LERDRVTDEGARADEAELAIAPEPGAAILALLSPREKAALTAGRDVWSLQGVGRLGVPSIVVADGPHGLRKQPRTDDLRVGGSLPATCFPTAAALAASWDPALVEEVGVALGEEARAAGVSVLLGPGADIKRSPACGRNFEYFSEDPLLSARLAAAWIRGVQRTGVGASLKHYAANNQERRRYSIDALVDERALREIYLASFEGAVVAGRPWTVMAAYNQVNGAHCTEHRGLLTGVLRGEWGFDGVVISDWGAVYDRVAAIAAGTDLQMPGFGGRGDQAVVRAVTNGRLSEATLDAAAARVLTLIARTRRARDGDAGYDVDAHHALARRAAAAGTVLLKNDGGLLPLSTDADLAVVGAFAEQPRYQGAGSSQVTPHRLDDALAAIVEAVGGADRLAFAPGYDRHGEDVDEAYLAEAREVARGRDAVVVFVGLPERYETEGLDRTHLRLPSSHDALVAAVTEVNPHVVVVLSNGAPVEMPWDAAVPAIVEGYLGGQAGGGAVADVLFGRVEPGGRLAETFPLRWDDHPVAALPAGTRQVEYRESVYVGYRYFDRAGVEVRYPFGHGLGYTTFAYSGLTLSADTVADGDDIEVTATVTVTNTGERAGVEVVQLYVHDAEANVFRPEQEIRAFAKVRLAPGEATTVDLVLDRRAFAYWDPGRGWTVEPGRFEIRVGASSRDIRAVAAFEVVAGAGSAAAARAANPAVASYHEPSPGRGFPRDAFAAVYSRPLPPDEPDRRGAYTVDTPIADMRASWVACRMLAIMHRVAARVDGTDPNDPSALLGRSMVAEMPPRLLPFVTKGVVQPPLVDALVDLFNGRYLRGVAGLLAGAVTSALDRLRRGR
jgi:beta-glucosidase